MPRLKLQLDLDNEESNHQKIKTLSAQKTFDWATVTLARLTSKTAGKNSHLVIRLPHQKSKFIAKEK